jgi:hypothetical protein
MRELAGTGYMSNRGRQNVASLLAKDLRQDWRAGGGPGVLACWRAGVLACWRAGVLACWLVCWCCWMDRQCPAAAVKPGGPPRCPPPPAPAGAALFESLLLDHDPAVNAVNWQYFAGVGNDPRNRHFKTVTQGEQYDEGAALAERWLPELARLPAALRHRPWEADEAAAAAAGYVRGVTYPEALVDPSSQIGLGPRKKQPQGQQGQPPGQPPGPGPVGRARAGAGGGGRRPAASSA